MSRAEGTAKKQLGRTRQWWLVLMATSFTSACAKKTISLPTSSCTLKAHLASTLTAQEAPDSHFNVIEEIQTHFATRQELFSENVQNTALNIIGGSPSGNSDDLEKATAGVFIVNKSANSSSALEICTGVVAGKNVILTAASCFDRPEGTIDQLTYATFKTELQSLNNNTDLISVQEIILHPNHISSDPDKTNFDIAILKLSANVPETQMVASFITAIESLTPNTEITAIGYGSTGSNNDDAGSKRRTNSFIQNVINTTNYPGTLLQDQIRVKDTLASTRGACDGDFGGPGFLKDKAEVFGLVQGPHPSVQGPNPTCELADFNYTLIAPYLTWIEEKLGYKLNVSGSPQSITSASGWVSSSTGGNTPDSPDNEPPSCR